MDIHSLTVPPRHQEREIPAPSNRLDGALPSCPAASGEPTLLAPPPVLEQTGMPIGADCQDYTNLSLCGGFAYDRPQGLGELEMATHARFQVAIAKQPEAGIEDFSYYHKWGARSPETELAIKYLQEGRLIAYARPGDNEGYIVQILASPLYLQDGSPVAIAHSKCWTREGSLALLHEVSELMVRW